MPSEPSVNAPDYAVGIGSSAGGLDALEGLVAAAGNAKATAFIVAQHLAPQHPSMLAELLSRSTTLRVVTAADGQPLESNVISIAPPGSDIVVSRDRIHLVAPEAATGPNPSVDRLLSSIAEHWGDHGVGVILSGTGSDGAYGMRAIKAADGLTIVQLPGTAKFESMPNAALAFGSGDLVLDPAQIGERLSHLGDPAADWLGDEVPLPGPDALSSVLRELRRSTGIDFSRYKESTLLRQIKRRMAILQVADIDDYLPLLVAQPAEPIALMNGMLVTVTSFFRDAESFKALHDHLRDYLASADDAEQIRIWVPGCATGEEVYSIAMIMASLLTDTADLSHRLKIFGTDLDESALTIARRGAYPAASLGTVPPDLSARYLFPSGQGVEVAPELRDLVVFARHNVAQDPPFARLDLISCRNTLIYFTAPLQHRVLQMFAYGLKAGGLLFLGASEAMAADAAGFANLDSAHRLFVRTDEVVSPRRAYVPGPVSRLREPAPRRPEVTPDTGVVSDLHLDVLEALATARIGPCLVLNERHEVVEIVGDVLPYCRIAPGRPSVAIDDFVRRELAAEARALLLVVRAKGQQVASGAITLDGIVGEVRLVAAPLAVGARTFTVVEFMTEVPGLAPPMQMGDRGPEFDQELDRLEEELLRSQDTLQGSLADLETAHEELLASNEELQASSEELQSSYEELATSNEELQASNEELSISNRNLRHQTDEIDRMRRSAEESLADFTRVTDALSEVVWQRDMTLGTLIYASQGIERLLGISLSELGSDASAIDALIAPEDIDRVEAARDPRGREWAVEYRLRPRDGTEIWIVERATVAKVRGEVDRVVGTLTNITDQKLAEAREHEQWVVFEAVFRAPFMGIAIVDEQSRVTQANDYFCELLGYAPGSVDGMPLAAFGYVEDDLAAGPSSDAIPLMSGLNTRLLLCRDGSRRWADVERRALVGLGGDSGTAMFVVRDITQLREQTEELSRRATTDAATGLLNREHFQHTLARQIVSGDQKGSSVALVWVDIDHFKEVNDRHGHAAGDEVLRRSAERIEAAVRSNDIVGRLGGDEFGVILTRFEGAAELETVLGRILSALRQPIAIGEAEIVVSGSLGVAVYPEDGVAPDTLMRSADAAMYAIKKRRGDGFEYFRPELTREAEARSSMREDIASAIRDERFTLFYQPILDATTGALWGVEALLRWRRNGDVVAAEHFIDFCESSGQIRDLAPLTFALLRGDLDALRRSGTEIGRACVNVSVSQLEDKTFTELMNWWPSPIGLAGLVMEITESVFLPDHHRAIETLHHLTHLGAEISVDDFGSGYSNLLLLESLAPTCIKLDKSFLASRALAGRGDELSSAAIKMAHSLQSIVVAEGIETDEQLASVRGLGANLVQGYAMASPMPRDDLVAWIREREPAGR